MAKIIEDLTEASALLRANDPIIENGVMNSSDPNGNSLRYRQYRMNYYAVQALLVRAYMWSKDNVNALATVTDLISEVEAKSTFPFTAASSITSTTNPTVYFPRGIFSLYNSQRKLIFTNIILPLHWVMILNICSKAGGTYSAGRVNALYDDANDYRFKMWGTTTLKEKR